VAEPAYHAIEAAFERDPVALARELIRCRSVTPTEGGALSVLARVLKPAGFTVSRMTFSDIGTSDVENLYARIGLAPPHLVFAGHTDVVPPGDVDAWRFAPFSGEFAEGHLYGRGAVDMKGSIAAFVAAVFEHLKTNDGKVKGSISLLITGDEEGPGVNGTQKLLKWAAERGQKFDHCLLGEPSSREALGDMIKIGRRGSLSGTLTVTGRQGHVAYPHLAKNPIHSMMRTMSDLMSDTLDHGTDNFDASNLEFTSVDVGNRAVNVIPAVARAKFNIRFNDRHTQQSLRGWFEARCAQAADSDVTWKVDYEQGNSDAFLTKPGRFVDVVSDAIAEVTERRPELSTSGGTSDARFIKNYCPVVEFGLVGATMHQTDERVPLADLRTLTEVYGRVLQKYFS
jgi:succinyl-diaminopimelate desuccinylase